MYKKIAMHAPSSLTAFVLGAWWAYAHIGTINTAKELLMPPVIYESSQAIKYVSQPVYNAQILYDFLQSYHGDNF